MPKFDATILQDIASVSKDYTIYKYNNGYMINLYATDSEDNRVTKEIACDSIEDVTQYIIEIDHMEVER